MYFSLFKCALHEQGESLCAQYCSWQKHSTVLCRYRAWLFFSREFHVANWIELLTQRLVCHNVEPWVSGARTWTAISLLITQLSACDSPLSLSWFPTYCHPWLPALPSRLWCSTPPRPPTDPFLRAVPRLEHFLRLALAQYSCSLPHSLSFRHCSVSNGPAPSQQFHQVDAVLASALTNASKRQALSRLTACRSCRCCRGA